MSQGSYPFHNSDNHNNNDDDTFMEFDSSEENRSSMHHSNNINLSTMTNISQHEDDNMNQLNNNKNNNLKFFPYSNNKLTRSTGTLNLSLSMINLQDLQNTTENNNIASITNPTTSTSSSTTTTNNNLQNINEVDEPVDQSMNRWSPFTETHPITPKLKRTASKSHLSPFINDTDTLSRWKYMKPDIQSKRNLNRKHDGLLRKPLLTQLLPANDASSNKENSDIFTDGISLFQSTNNNNTNDGLQSKLISKDEILNNRNKKSMIPNTPIKRNPLKETTTNIFSPIFHEFDLSPNNKNRNGNNSNSTIYNDDINNMNNNLTFTKSPSIMTPKLKLPSLLGSPRSPSPQIDEDIFYSGSRQSKFYQHSPQHSNNSSNKSLKKIKKSRESVIFKNVELTHSLQQFTDDLYGTDDDIDLIQNKNKAKNTQEQYVSNHHPESSLSFFHKFPPPIKLPTRAKNNISPVRTLDSDNNSSDEQCLATPTRKNFHHDKQREERMNMKLSQIQPPAIKIESPPDKITSTSSTNESSRTERNINASVKNRIIPQAAPVNPDTHLYEQFNNVQVIGQGQFSKVYQVTLPDTGNKYAVKSVNPNKHNPKARIIQEISLLAEISKTPSNDQEGKEYIIDFISSWKEMDTFYIMTNYYENGNLDKFLEEQIVSKKKRLEDWRIWKIVVELSLALRFIHDACHIVHLDIKPANVMITFEGNLKLADFGMATHLPLEDLSFENEGDREYIAPEIISDCVYDFSADIFSLGLMIVEIAANVVLPDNGNAWHKLRSGDLSDAGRLSSTEIHSESLFSTASTKVDTKLNDYSSFLEENSSQLNSNNNNNNNIRNNNSLNLNKYNTTISRATSQGSKIPAWVPKFLIDGRSLEKMVKWMIEPDYKKRPTASQILETEECQYVEVTRKAGAVIQEDDFGPKPNFFD